MSLGTHFGAHLGTHLGSTIGTVLGADPMAGITPDATSLKYCPASSAEWTTTLAGISAAGNPFALWLMQESSGALADSIDAFDLTVDSFAYEQTITGWTRKAMLANDLGGFNVLYTTDAGLPDLSAESCTVLGYVMIDGEGAGDRGVLLAGDVRGVNTATNVPKINNGTNTGTGAASVTTVVRPWVLRHNVTASSQALFTDLEKVSVTFAASGSTKRIYFGAAFESCPNIRIVYGCAFRGAAAELSDAQVRSLLQRLGWTVAW